MRQSSLILCKCVRKWRVKCLRKWNKKKMLVHNMTSLDNCLGAADSRTRTRKQHHQHTHTHKASQQTATLISLHFLFDDKLERWDLWKCATCSIPHENVDNLLIECWNSVLMRWTRLHEAQNSTWQNTTPRVMMSVKLREKKWARELHWVKYDNFRWVLIDFHWKIMSSTS